MLRRGLTLIVVGALTFQGAAAGPIVDARASTPDAARSASSGPEVDALIGDSLTAMASLISSENCSPLDAADGDVENGLDLAFIRCDDGLPPSGGGSAGIPVPAKYAANAKGNDWSRLPKPATVEETAEADVEEDLQPESDNRITLDVNVTLPPSPRVTKEFGLELPTVKPPRRGFPVIVLMHGCCGGNKTSWEAASVDAAGEQWHHSSAWWASQGYVVINYTARGFRNGNDQGSTGTTQLDSRRYEVNDYQYLVGLLADLDAERKAAGDKPLIKVNPKKIGAVGGSYGGGFSWLALTDPRWKSPAFDIPVKLAAAVPKYGWTDLLESLVPSGQYRDTKVGAPSKTAVAPTKPAAALSRHPFGVEKLSIVAGLYGTGNNSSGNHTTFPQYLHDAYARLQQGEPYEGDETLEAVVDSFLRDRSAYFQNGFWKKVKKGMRIPLFAAGTWTDPLFPTMETLRFYNKLKSVAPKYPVTAYFGDYQHFVANKAKEWGDLCGEDHHVCTMEDFSRTGNIIGGSSTRVRVGINTRINRFLDHYLRGKGKTPKRNVSATTTVCAVNATDKYKVDEPGAEYRAKTWRKLAPSTRKFAWDTGGMVASVAVDAHAADSDPVFRSQQSNKCYTTTQTDPGLGVLQYESDPLAEETTVLGLPVVKLDLDTSATEYWISARLLDLAPDGNLTLVSRGVCKANLSTDADADCSDFTMFGNAWMFAEGHSLVLEISQSDTPFLRKTNTPTTVNVAAAELVVPVAPPERRKDFRD